MSNQRHAPAAASLEATERPKRSQQCPQQLAVFLAGLQPPQQKLVLP